MKAYVAGPMTGYPEWNFPEFRRWTEALREEGFEVTSPAEIDEEEGFDSSGDGAGFDLEAALNRDVEKVLEADGVALLDGWEESPGAVIEVLAASSKGAPALPVREFLRKFGATAALVMAVVIGAPVAWLTGSALSGNGPQAVAAVADAVPAAEPTARAVVQTVQDNTGAVQE